MTALVDKGTLYIQGKKIEGPTPVGQFLECGQIIIVRWENILGKNFNRNVWAFDQEGKLLWKIEELPVDEGTIAPFTHIGLQGGILTGYNWLGYNYFIDPKNGKITLEQLKARPW